MRQRGKPTAARRSGARVSRRLPWIGAAVLAVVVGIALLSADGAPPSRMIGAGMVPDLPARPTALPPPTIPQAPAPRIAEAPAPAVEAEEQRIAVLRETRQRLEAEIALLQDEAARRLRDLPGRKVTPDAPPPPGTTFTSVPMPPPPAATPAPQGDPALRGLRVFIHHRVNSTQGAATAQEIADRLRDTGADMALPRTAPFVPSTPVVRYFHDEDQAAAARIAGRLGRGWAIQDFRAYLPQPAPQTIEVWIPGG